MTRYLPAVWRQITLASVAALGLGGCQSTVLNRDVRNMANSVIPIYQEQALDNIVRFDQDNISLPSQLDIGSGSVSNTYGLTPTLTLPIGNQVVRGASDTVTAITEQYRSVSFGGSWTRMANWSVTAVTDPVRLYNLMLMYQAVLFGPEGLKQHYHFPTKTDPQGKVGADPYYVTRPECVYCCLPLENRKPLPQPAGSKAPAPAAATLNRSANPAANSLGGTARQPGQAAAAAAPDDPDAKAIADAIDDDNEASLMGNLSSCKLNSIFSSPWIKVVPIQDQHPPGFPKRIGTAGLHAVYETQEAYDRRYWARFMLLLLPTGSAKSP